MSGGSGHVTIISELIANIQLIGKPYISLRWIIVILGFSLNFVEFFIRNSFPVALLAMVNSTDSRVDTNHSWNTSMTEGEATVIESSPLTSSGDFDWDSTEQGIILAAFFWGFFIAKLLTSRITEIVGQREAIGVGTATSIFLVFSAPIAASIHPYVLAMVRFLTGLCFGPSPAAMHSLLSAWAPREELSSMVTTVEAGLACGGMVGLFASGWLTKNYGWKIIFWIGGAINALFLPSWLIFVRNSPEKHPWLSPYEATLLKANHEVKTKKSVPWIKLLTSRFVIICILCHFVRSALDVIIATEGPSFLTYKIGLDLSVSSYVCGASYMASIPFALVFGRISDILIRRKCLSKIKTRKLFHFIGCAGSAIMFLGIVLAGGNSLLVIVLWILLGGILAANACSYLISVIDFAPNYTGTVVGLMAVGNFGGVLSPTIVSALLNKENGWNLIFLLCAGASLLSCAAYIPFMTTEPQPWNYAKSKDEHKNSII